VRRRLALALVVLLALSAGVAHGADRDKSLAVGDRAPDFTLQDHQGQPVRLSEVLRQREFVVLAFYIQADTPG
jgi:hypothetical protein